MNKEIKTQIIEQYRINEKDTGSPEVQIALLTYRINNLTEHLKENKRTIIQEEVFYKWLDEEEVFWTT